MRFRTSSQIINLSRCEEARQIGQDGPDQTARPFTRRLAATRFVERIAFTANRDIERSFAPTMCCVSRRELPRRVAF